MSLGGLFSVCFVDRLIESVLSGCPWLVTPHESSYLLLAKVTYYVLNYYIT